MSAFQDISKLVNTAADISEESLSKPIADLKEVALELVLPALEPEIIEKYTNLALSKNVEQKEEQERLQRVDRENSEQTLSTKKVLV